jgi:signal transduction histidine kinase/CheY-like chemotaxis protein/HAMP domain-containing protein
VGVLSRRSETTVDRETAEALLATIEAALQGDFDARPRVRPSDPLARELVEGVDRLLADNRGFVEELERLRRVIGEDGRMTERAQPETVGPWERGARAVNELVDDLVRPTSEVARVITAVAQGDLSQKLTVDAKGEILELESTINTMVDQLSSFADEVTRVAREVGTEGKLGGQARVQGVSGVWRDLTENVNGMASNLTSQVRSIAQVTTAVAQGDLSQKIAVDAKGEILELKSTINTMVDQLSSFADEVTRVAGEVGTEGKLGGQARVKGVSGVWKELTDNVNQLAANLTSQVRNIAQVTTAVAQGDLSQKITVDVSGEILELKNTINTMVDQLSSFADEVTRVAREVGTEGKLGGQARVGGVSGIWEDLTDNVNQLAANLTTQVRAIAEVSTAVTRGDLTRSITVEASGEVAELKDNLNQMIANLRETTTKNAEQDWLKTNMARIGTLLQGQRDIQTVADLIMSELSPLVSAQHAAFFLTTSDGTGPTTDEGTTLVLSASYGYLERRAVPTSFRMGEGLVGQAARERKPILLTDAPADYVKVTSGLGEAAPVSVFILPIVFEGSVLGVLELASLTPFPAVNRQFLLELVETLGVVLNTLRATMRTEELLDESQRLTAELQSQSGELQAQQQELQRANDELHEKAELLADQKRAVEVKNREIEDARRSLQEKAEQLALSSKYKSEFLANMSHELRTPLNSMLLLAKLLVDDPDGTLSEEQIEFARTIHGSGNDLLDLINEILDLSKIEAGHMEVVPSQVSVERLVGFVQRSFAPHAAQQELAFDVTVADDVPTTMITDERRVQQVLKNLLSNAFKFTEQGRVALRVETADAGRAVRFDVEDTGIGVPEDKLAIVFEAFQQADGSTSRRFGGTGLGLSISRELAGLLGGSLEVTSEVGVGSTFSLVVPVEHPGAIEDGDDPVGPRRSLLLVASPERRGRLRGLASSVGLTVVPVADRDGAMTVVAEERPAAVLLDLELATASPYGLLGELLRADELQSVPIVVLGPRRRTRVAVRAGAFDAAEPDDDAAIVGALERARDRAETSERTVLVLDDVASDRVGTARLLEGADIRLLRARAVDEALALLAEERPDGVVLDMQDPEAAATVVRRVADGATWPVPVLIHDRGQDGELRDALAAVDTGPLVVTVTTSQRSLMRAAARRLHRREVVGAREAGDTLAGRRLMLVDDDERNLEALAHTLRRHGAELVLASDGEEALAVLDRGERMDLIVLDVMMPGMDGLETARAIRSRADGGDVPIVMLTAKAQPEDRAAGLAAGANDFVTKPVDVERLLALLEVWLTDA